MDYKEYNFQSFFEEIIKIHGKPDYAIGVTFGVDFDKWRCINKTVFGLDFSEKIKFEKSFLFTDKIYIKDTNPNRDLYNGNLLYAIPDVKGYLHTKFVLLCYAEKYVLVLSTKNINGNSSYDYVVPLIFTKQEGAGHGASVKEYLKYIIEKSRDYSIPKELEDYIEKLDGYHITASLDGFQVSSFEFAFENNRFSDELWEKIKNSTKIVSPYLDEDMIKELSANAKVLAYPEQIKKIWEVPKKTNIEFRVGKGEYRNGQLVAQRKYHAKLYFGWDDEESKGRMIVGSANLTKAAKCNYCEMLVELIADDKAIYEAREAFFCHDDWTEPYNPKTDYTVLTEEESFDDENLTPIVGNKSKIYVKLDSDTEMFSVHIVSEDFQDDKVWGMPYVVASYFVICAQEMLYVDKNRYVSEDNIQKFSGALSYGEYSKYVEERKNRLQNESDKWILTGKRQGYSDWSGKNRRESGNSVAMEDIPCLFNILFTNLEKKRNNSKGKTAGISREMIIEELKNIRNSLFNKEWIEQINRMLKELENTNE